ncbi:MAG TPA: hypothetical protein VJJ82_05450 [Candidatus Nanoarchaeia archaeon]|nr:hypothetical protein [Candidatus Nanoarchaeia archaeon]
MSIIGQAGAVLTRWFGGKTEDIESDVNRIAKQARTEKSTPIKPTKRTLNPSSIKNGIRTALELLRDAVERRDVPTIRRQAIVIQSSAGLLTRAVSDSKFEECAVIRQSAQAILTSAQSIEGGQGNLLDAQSAILAHKQVIEVQLALLS